MKEDKPFWFEAKTYGLGWSLPVTWQGWLTVLTYLVLLIAGLVLIPRGSRWPYVVAITVILVAIIVWKGEKPFRWRWHRD